MKIKHILLTIATVAIIIVVWHLFAVATSKKDIVVKKIDTQEIYIGPDLKKSKENSINSVLREIDDASNYMRNGNEYVKSGQYQNAIEVYTKAYSYSAHTSTGTMAGLKLVELYEKMGRYDEGIALINEIDEKYYKSEYGHQKAAAIRERLIAAGASQVVGGHDGDARSCGGVRREVAGAACRAHRSAINGSCPAARQAGAGDRQNPKRICSCIVRGG